MVNVEKVGVAGLGLIGGSFARALRAAHPGLSLHGHDPDQTQARRALELGVVDEVATDLESLAAEVELLVIAAPVSVLADCIGRAARAAPTTVITDTGSVKQPLIDALAGQGGVPERYVPGHPIAGGERFGVEAADVSLFRGRRVILTPVAHTSVAAVAMVRAAWQAAGAVVQNMEAGHHDEVLAATSHLPHVLAYALVDCLSGMEDRREIFQYAAGGFRDFTRIASSNPEMWRDIVHINRAAVLTALGEFETVLGGLRRAIEDDDQAALLAAFTRARAARQRFLELVEKPAGSS